MPLAGEYHQVADPVPGGPASRFACSSPLPTITSRARPSFSSGAAASITRPNCLLGSSRPKTPITNSDGPAPNSARTRARATGSNATRPRSTPFGITVTFRDGTPQPVIRAATMADTATVICENHPVARYSARTPAVILRRSRCVSPIECSVETTTGVPASHAAGRPYTCDRYRCACTTSYPPSRISRRNRHNTPTCVLRDIPTSRTRTPSRPIISATGPGLYSVTTSASCRLCCNTERNCNSAPPTPSPVITCKTFIANPRVTS